MTTTIAVERRRPKGPLAWLLVSQALTVLSLLPWVLVFALSVLGGGGAAWAMPVLALIWAYPLLVLLCMVMAWRAYRRGNGARAMILTTLPLVLAVPLAAYAYWLATSPG